MKTLIRILIPVIFILSLSPGCNTRQSKNNTAMKDTNSTTIVKEAWGKADGKEVYLFTLKNKNGVTVRITNYGGIITSILTPDNKGNFSDIVLGHDSLRQYLKNDPYLGATVGRYANRIAKGRFTLDGRTYQLAVNNGNNSLHGGIKGFDKVVWDATTMVDSMGQNLVMTYLSKDGEEGYPGNLSVKVIFNLNDFNELAIVFGATTDKPTVLNLCNHTYFNLSGGSSDILKDVLTIYANKYTVVNDEFIPTGELRSVNGTPMDFRIPISVGARIAKVTGGYDHNYVLAKEPGKMCTAAILEDKFSGRSVEVLTTQPGLQFYTGNFLDGSITGKNGVVYRQHYGLCLETQHFPDSPNHPEFPSTVLKPGEQFREVTAFRFGVK
jgi:aldose 1-epimerase